MHDDLAIPVRERSPDASGQAPRRREQQVAALAELALLALRETDLDAVLRAGAQQLREALDCEYTSILDARAGARGLIVSSGAGWPEDVLAAIEAPSGSGSQAGYTLEVGVPVIVDDLRNDGRFTPADCLLELGIRSGLSVVIEGDGEPLGVLLASSLEAGRFTALDVPVISAYARVLGMAIQQHEREQLSADFATIAAHELRTPLMLLIGYSSRLLRRLDEDGTITADLREEVEVLHSESLQLRRAIDTFLALGEIERRHVAPGVITADLVEAAAAAAAEVAERYPGAVIEVEHVSPRVAWTTDELAVQHVIRNLIENGVKYSPAGSRISVHVAVEGNGDDDGRAVVSVHDRCGGLADEDLRHLFRRNFRGERARAGRGLGLGLYVGQRLAARVGGSLSARNEGDGCVFTLRLPRMEEPPPKPRPASA